MRRPLAAGPVWSISYIDPREPPTTALSVDATVACMNGLHHDDAPQARFPFDPIYKALCCHRQTVADMLRGWPSRSARLVGACWMPSTWAR